MLCYTITHRNGLDDTTNKRDDASGQDGFRRAQGDDGDPAGAERAPTPGLDRLHHAAAVGRRRLGPGLVVMSTAAIQLDDLTLGYDRHPAVHHLSGSFAAGSLTAIVGPNGAGKTTLLKAIVGL